MVDCSRYYKKCLLCPRACGVDRVADVRGDAPGQPCCGETAELRLASASIHRGEEPPITGAGGSGTIFISGCNLGCVFCQNHQISKRGKAGGEPMGRAVSAAEFAEICLALQKRGAENINIVTGSHAVPAIVAGVEEARRQGLAIPLLWNSSGYEGAVSLALLKDTVDVYLPDLKTFDSLVAARFFNAPDYPRVAADAIRKMMEHRALSYGEGRGQGPAAGVLKSGVMVRHLILPGFLDATRDVLRWFAANCRGRALLSVMTQYTPVGGGLTAAAPLGEAAMPSRCVTPEEYETVLGWLDEFGIDDGFCQELITGSEWLPDFSRLNPFSSELSTPAWHWREGFADNGTLCEMYKKDTLKNI